MDFAQGACIVSLQPSFVRVELARFVGIPQIVIVGLPTQVASETKERLVAIAKTLGIKLPHCRFVFSLSPPCQVRSGAGLDLALLVTLFHSLGVLRKDIVLHERQLWLGALRLDGTVCSTIGIPVLIEAAAQLGYSEVWCSNLYRPLFEEIEFGIRIHFIDHVADLVSLPSSHCKKQLKHIVTSTPSQTLKTKHRQNELPDPDWQVLLSQPMVQKALLIAAAGWHHTLLIGPPGLGKTTVAALLIKLLPTLQPDELLQVLKVRSLLDDSLDKVTQRMCVHVSAQTTITSLFGSLKSGRLGAVTKAHKGVLFLDELLHFPTQVLDALRDPLELGTVALQPSDNRFPADFLFIGVTNPCKCGNALSQFARCRCGTNSTVQLQRKLDASWLDRMSLSMYIDYQPTRWQVQPLDQELTSGIISQLKAIVQTVWVQQQKRWGVGWHNGIVRSLDQLAQLEVSDEALSLLRQTKQQQSLSERSSNKLLLVASTIADIESASNHASSRPVVEARHVAEATQFRIKLFSS